MKRFLLLWLGLVVHSWVTSGVMAQPVTPPLPSTPYTRDLLRTTNAATARSHLGITVTNLTGAANLAVDGFIYADYATVNAAHAMNTSPAANSLVMRDWVLGQLSGHQTNSALYIYDPNDMDAPWFKAVPGEGVVLSAASTFQGVFDGYHTGSFGGSYEGNGGSITGLNASAISSGTVPIARLPSGILTNNQSGVTLSGTFEGIAGLNLAGSSNVNLTTATGVLPLSVLPASLLLVPTSGTNVAVNVSASLAFHIILTNNVWFSAPTNLVPGAQFAINLVQDSAGQRTVRFDPNYWRFPSGQVLTTTTNAGSWSIISGMVGQYGTNVAVVQTLNFQ